MNKFIWRFQSFPTLFTIFLFSSGALEAASALADAPSFSLAAKELQADAKTDAEPARASAVILVSDEHWIFHPDSTLDRRQHLIYKIIDSSAVQGWSTVQARWEPWHQERPLIRARVITADGSQHDLDAKTLVDSVAGQNTPQTFTDSRVLAGPLPAIEAGAIVEAEILEHSSPVLGSFAFQSLIASKVPVQFSRLTAEYPEALPLRYAVALCPTLKESKETRAGVTYLSLDFGSFKVLDDPDVFLPFDEPPFPEWFLSTGESWSDLASRYTKIVDQQIEGAPVRQLVADAGKAGGDRSDRIERLVRALHTQVRYTGVEFADAAIVPAKPEETMKRKYGDCKDKATLLVATLRTAGIPAYLAILNAGQGEDVHVNLPAMGMFNHAIVYVPGSPDLWIDATAEHMRTGTVPPDDQGRLALIIRPETTGLTKIPESPSLASLSTTDIEYFLPDFGRSRVVQTLSGSGVYDSNYRGFAQAFQNAEFRKQFDLQTQAQWDTKSAIKLTVGSPDDYLQPLMIKIGIADTKVLTVSETGLVYSLPAASVLSNLPPFFLTEDKDKNTHVAGAKSGRTAGFVFPLAYIEKASFRFHIPNGFQVKKVPEDQSIKMGPASFTAHYALLDQLLTAEYSLDLGKRDYTADEGAAFKKKILEFEKQPMPTVNFQMAGQTLLDDGHFRPGLDAFRSLAAQHGTEAINHVRLARAYMQIGCGMEARQEANLASRMQPALALTWRTVAFVYEHDLLGRAYKEGWDPAVVEAALRKAATLDPDEDSINLELTTAFAFDSFGDDYASVDRMRKALAIFRALGDDKVEQQRYQDTMLYELALTGDLEELKSKLDRFGSNGSRAGDRVFLNTMREGAAKAALDLQASASGDELKQAFLSAAGLLAASRKYQLEADLAAALHLDSALFAPLEDLRKAHPVEFESLQDGSPEELVRSFSAALSTRDTTIDTLCQFWVSTLKRDKLSRILQTWRTAELAGLSSRGISLTVNRDMTLSNVRATIDSNGESGFRVRLTSAGRVNTAFVLKEHGSLKMLGTDHLWSAVGEQALADVQRGSIDSARKWLDWTRETIKLRSGDDPLADMVFPHVWTKGSPASADQIRYAAAVLAFSKDALSILQEAINATSEPVLKGYFELAYTNICSSTRDWTHGLTTAKALAEAYPASETAQRLLARVYAGLNRVPDGEASLQAAIAHDPDSLGFKRELANFYGMTGQGKKAIAMAKSVAEDAGSVAADWNQYGWFSLEAGEIDEAKVHAVERGAPQADPSIQHTIASMYAEVGDVSDARRIALETLDKFGLYDPDSPWFYVFGRIAEQLGARESALIFYGKIKAAADGDDPTSTAALVRKRLAVINGTGSSGK